MWLYYGLVAFATRPKEKQHDEIPPVRMTYTGGTGGDHGHDLLPYVQFPMMLEQAATAPRST